MKQSRLASFIESAINILVGFGISLGAQILFLPMLGVPISLGQNFSFALIMTAISLGRQFILRRVFEALHIRDPLSPAALAMVAERRRQRETEGWSDAHDDAHEDGELATAGCCYVLNAFDSKSTPPAMWPWERKWWKPQGFWRDLVRGAALILAEMDRALRKRNQKTKRTSVVVEKTPPMPNAEILP